MRPGSRRRPALESLDGRLLLSRASPHAAPPRVATIHLHGPATDDASLGGDLAPGEPETIRIVADRTNVVNVSVRSVDGGHVSVRVGGMNASKAYTIFTSSSVAGDASPGDGVLGSATVGETSARSATVMVKVAGRGRHTLVASAMKVSKSLHPPGTTPPPRALPD